MTYGIRPSRMRRTVVLWAKSLLNAILFFAIFMVGALLLSYRLLPAPLPVPQYLRIGGGWALVLAGSILWSLCLDSFSRRGRGTPFALGALLAVPGRSGLRRQTIAGSWRDRGAVEDPLGVAPPRRERDPHFDLAYHVRRLRVPAAGTLRDLLDLAAPIAKQAFDKDRPLWELHAVEGLEHGRFGVILKIHHAMTDGVGMVRMTELIDVDRDLFRYHTPRAEIGAGVVEDRYPCFISLLECVGVGSDRTQLLPRLACLPRRTQHDAGCLARPLVATGPSHGAANLARQPPARSFLRIAATVKPVGAARVRAPPGAQRNLSIRTGFRVSAARAANLACWV